MDDLLEPNSAIDLLGPCCSITFFSSHMDKKATLLLPKGVEIYLEDFDLTLGGMIQLVQETLDDENITPECFGPGKYSSS